MVKLGMTERDLLLLFISNNLLWFIFVYIMLPSHRFLGTKKIGVAKEIKKLFGREKTKEFLSVEKISTAQLKEALLKEKEK